MTSLQEALATLQKQISEKSLPNLLKREFLSVGDKSIDGQEFCVMQWNLLAQALSSGADNFVLCPPEALEWNQRQLRILEEIYRIQPAILCLQEVDFFSFLKEKLQKLGYEGVWVKKPFSPCLDIEGNMGPDGCALFYKTDKFKMVNHEFVNLKDGLSCNTNQTAVICKFDVIHNSSKVKSFYVAVVHLKAKSGYENLRHDQGKYLLNVLKDKVVAEPLIVCGDFNASPKEPVYQEFVNHSLGLASQYKLLSSENKEPPYTTWKIRAGFNGNTESCKTIDYIWMTGNIHVTSVLSIPTDEDIGANRLPSFQYPSDHFSLACKFCFS